MVPCASRMEAAAGTRVEHLVLERQIGSGGMGTVWAARDARTGKLLALKILRLSDPSSSEVLCARLLREAQATRLIAHPAIVPVMDVVDYAGSPALVMDLLTGETLRDRLVRDGRLTVATVARLLAPIADALAAAHRAGIVHRDLKPENIFIEAGEQNRIRLLDFGVARFFEPSLAGIGAGSEAPLTDLGTLIGTLAYMAPEQALRPSECDERVDTWALGVILYEALSGCRPIEGGNGPETMRQLLIGGITPLDVVMPGLPEGLTALVDRMMARAPERRPKTLAEVASTLRRYSDESRGGAEP
jgi:eukaryotic-like serine/threonine-protein kinase